MSWKSVVKKKKKLQLGGNVGLVWARKENVGFLIRSRFETNPSGLSPARGDGWHFILVCSFLHFPTNSFKFSPCFEGELWTQRESTVKEHEKFNRFYRAFKRSLASIWKGRLLFQRKRCSLINYILLKETKWWHYTLWKYFSPFTLNGSSSFLTEQADFN